MKLFKKSIFAAVALFALAFTACEEDENYTPGAQSAGVYFPEVTETVELMRNATTFDITVKRTGETAAATYGVVVESEYLDFFTVPTEVSFAEGETTAALTFGYNPEDLVVGFEIPFTIKLAEGVSDMAYGKSAIEFYAALAINWSEWTPMTEGQARGTGKYYYEYIDFNGGFFPTMLGLDKVTTSLPAHVRYDLDNPTVQQLRVSKWGMGTELLIDFDTSDKVNDPETGAETDLIVCHLAPNYTGLVYDEAGTLLIWAMDQYNFFKELGISTAGTEELSYFDPSTGTFYINILYGMIDEQFEDGYALFGMGYEVFQLDGYDYGAVVNYTGTFTPESGSPVAVVDVTVGTEATEARIAMASGVGVDALADMIMTDQVEYMTLAPGTTYAGLEFPITAEGQQTIVAVTYEGDAPKAYGYDQFTYSAGGEVIKQWEPAGMGVIIDGWVTPMYGFKNEDGSYANYDEIAWEFYVERCTNVPGYYRLMDLYTDENLCPYRLYDINADPNSTHVEVDITNPDCVIIHPQYSGMTVTYNDGTTAKVSIANIAGMLMADDPTITSDIIIEAGLNDVVTEDGRVTIGIPVLTLDDPTDMDTWGFNSDDQGKTCSTPGLLYLEALDASAGQAARIKGMSRVNNFVKAEFKNNYGLGKINYDLKKSEKKELTPLANPTFDVKPCPFLR